MQILQIGLSHQTAPVEVREKLALAEAAIADALGVLCPDNGCGPGYALEGAILSTCNRLEVYAVTECADGGQKDLRDYLARVTGVAQTIFDPYLRVREGEVAVSHLCDVACGLDSLVLGESQIQGQVAEAHQMAMASGASGPVINALFRTALRAGKRARTETAINQYATSISHVAVELALQIFDDLATKTVVLVGAGEMAELAAKNLVDNGVGKLLVVNRSAGRAAGLAKAYGGEPLGWDRLAQALWKSDIVISSTAAPHPILRRDTVANAMRMRRSRALFIIDIAVPRDAEPEVGNLTNVFLYDIDDLQQVLEANLEQRRREVPQVQAIIGEEVEGYSAWLHARDVVPTIIDLRQHVDGLREAEVAWALNKLEGLSDQERNVVLALSQRLVSKIMHEPTVRLKQHAKGREAYRYTEAVRDLFGIGDPEGGPDEGGHVANVALFLLAAVFYAISTLAYVACWLGASRRCEQLAQPMLVAAVVLHGMAILLRWIQAGYAPLSNGFEAFSFYAWGLCLAYLLIPSLRRQKVLGAFVTPLALLSILAASVLPKRIEPLVPVLQSYWLPIHVSISFAAYAMFTLAFVAAVTYLLKLGALHHPGRRQWARRLPSLENSETLQRRTAVVGLVLMTGALISGSLWAEKAWGIVWPWEPQQVAALVTWLIYAIYFYLRHSAGWGDRRGAWLLVGGFVSVLITFVGADLLMLHSRHSFLFGS